MKLNRTEKIFVLSGLLLIAAALCLVAYNLSSEFIAGRRAVNALEAMETATDAPDEDIPAYMNNPYMEMPAVEIDGIEYIGRIDVPSLEISLPVIKEWSYPLMKHAPCLYEGSAYLKDMIIMGHNYKTHFGPLKNISQGDSVYFTDADGNAFAYTVAAVEILNRQDVEEMSYGEWDLTLFTCDTSGKMRITVRCEAAD